MPQAPKPLDPSLSTKHRFGAELRAKRVGRGMSQAELAKRVHVHRDLIAKVEKAARWPTEALAISCDSALGTGGTLAVLWTDVARERQPGRSPTLRGVADGVEGLDIFEPVGDVANRLWRLGTSGAEAAMSVLETGIADLVEQYETEDPASLAPDAVMLRRSLERLTHAQPSGSQRRQLLGLAGRASALLAYMAVNLGRFTHAHAYSAEAYALARQASDRGLMAWIRGTQSFASYYRRDYRRAVEYARDGLRAAGDGPQALRLKVNCEARALAFLPGCRREAEHAVAEAYKLADRLDVPEGISPCISFGTYSRGRVIANAITVFQTLGQTDEAVNLVEDIEESVQASQSAWSRSLIDLDHATTLLHRPDPDVEEAMRLACAALAASNDRPITSIVQRGHAVARSVARFSHLHSVQEFRERMRMVTVASESRRRTPVTYARRHDGFEPATVSA